jgi:hypothetical protein
MTRATDIFAENADARVKEVKSWLKSRGVREFEPVSLFSDQLTKDTVGEIEEYANDINKNRSTTAIKKAIVKSIPRHAVLKPVHAIYRLQNQHFALGDRVTMVQDSGGVPLSVKGVVIGLNSKSLDVVWDVPFMAGVTLGDRYLSSYCQILSASWSLTEYFSRCSPYRGSTVQFNSCLNLSNPQFIVSTHPTSVPPPRLNVPFKPRAGPYPAIRPAPGQPAAAGFRPAPQRQQSAPVAIMANPNRGRDAGFPNGLKPKGSYATVGGTSAPAGSSAAPGPNHPPGGYGNLGNSTHGRGRGLLKDHSATGVQNQSSSEHSQRDASGSGTHNHDEEDVGASHRHHNPSEHSSGPHGQGGFNNTRGRGTHGFDRGRRGRGGFRGRGRGGQAGVPYVVVPPLPSS